MAKVNHIKAAEAQIGSKDKNNFLSMKKQNKEIMNDSLKFMNKFQKAKKITYSDLQKESKLAAQFHQAFANPKKLEENYKKLHVGTLVDLQQVYIKDMHEWAVQNGAKKPTDKWEEFAKELAIHLCFKFTKIVENSHGINHSKVGKEFFRTR